MSRAYESSHPAAAGTRSYALPRVMPFVLFMVFIGLQEALAYLAPLIDLRVDDRMAAFLYPARGIAVAALLLALRRHYTEILWRDLLDLRKATISLGIGLLVFVLWINMDGGWGTVGTVKGFDPEIFVAGRERWTMIFFRVAGMAIVVPVMEELFWRSFLARWLIGPDVEKVPVGKFNTPSFAISAVLFGLEHNMVAAGVMAGAGYNFLLYRTRSVACCIAAHAVTNALLGVFILATGNHHLW